MLNFNISFTSLAVILWSGMLIISGSIWVLSSQVRKLVDLLERQGKAVLREDHSAPGAVVYPMPRVRREAVRRGVGRSTARVS